MVRMEGCEEMIIEYDMTPGISPEKRLQSLAESAQRAIDELENRTTEMQAEIDKLKKNT